MVCARMVWFVMLEVVVLRSGFLWLFVFAFLLIVGYGVLVCVAC